MVLGAGGDVTRSCSNPGKGGCRSTPDSAVAESFGWMITLPPIARYRAKLSRVRRSPVAGHSMRWKYVSGRCCQLSNPALSIPAMAAV